jgi:SAM-dependent methyltransferase
MILLGMSGKRNGLPNDGLQRMNDTPIPLRETSHPALYYQDMLSDNRRMERYRAAIEQVVKPGDVVVDLGTGLAVLAIMAAQAGAGKVYAVDVRPQVIPFAERVVAANGFSDVITVVQSNATELELPEAVDVIINELIGDFGTDENIYECVQAVAERHLKPGGRVLPNRLTTRLLGVCYRDEFRGVYRDPFQGIDLSAAISDGKPFEPAAVMYGLRQMPIELTRSIPVECIDFEKPMPQRAYEYELELNVLQDGDLQGLVGYFDAELAPGISLNNYPCYPGCHWVNWHWPVMPVRPVRAGEILRGRLQTPPLTVASVWRWQWR